MMNDTTLSALGGFAIEDRSRHDEMSLLPAPSFSVRFLLGVQSAVGRVLLLPFGGLLVFLMRFCAGYRIENVKALRREFAALTEERKPLLICMNHLNFIDSALLIWALAPLPRYVLSWRRFTWNLPAGDFFKKKLVFRVIAYLSKCIFIHRDGSKSHKNEILGICRHLLSNNGLVTIFPEGKRSRLGIFDREHITYGVGKLLHTVPGCRVLCVYLRSDRQQSYAGYPPKGSKFEILTRVIQPTTERLGKDAYFDLASQVADNIKDLEKIYFENKGGVPAPGFKRTALVTGASEGIGRDLARELAADAHDLVLVARNQERLESLAAECEKRYGARARIVVSDLSLPGSARELCETLSRDGVTLDVLVNNAGFGVHGAFHSTDLAAELALVQTQLASAIELTKSVLPGMIERRRGKILHVASVYAYAPVPNQSVYAACKAFLGSFSESLAAEVEGKGIDVTLLCPGATQTELRKRAGVTDKPGAGHSASMVARAGYRGLKRGKRIVIPGRLNRAFVHVMRHLPVSGRSALMRRINRARGVDAR